MLYLIALLIGCLIGFIAGKGHITINHNYTHHVEAVSAPSENAKVEQDENDFKHSVAAALQEVFDIDDSIK